MLWALLFAFVVLAVCLWRVARKLRHLDATWHDAANRAMRRHRRDRWRWRETEHVLLMLARETLPGLDMPPIADGPPNDPSDGHDEP